jgi:chromosomal replication initiator protein
MLRAGGFAPLFQLDEIDAALGQVLRRRIGEPRYNLWFAGKTRFVQNGDHLAVGVPNLFLHDWLHQTFEADVRAAAAEVLGQPVAVRFVIDAELFQAARQREGAPPPQSPSQTPTAQPQAAAALKKPRPRRWRGLDDFVVGACNRVAHAAAVGLVEAPQDVPCPLVVHGPVGTGKTHLLEGIHAGLARCEPQWRVVFATAEEFTNRFVQAMQLGKLAAFRKQFRECDALLLDDLHFLARKQATQEEFLHTLDALATLGRPIALTCDSHPRLADALLPEMIDRLAGGAVWGLTTPDHLTRALIVRAKAARLGGMPEAVLAFLADHLHGNVRELEGAIHGVLHLARVTSRPLDVALAREALADVLRHSVRMVRLQDVEKAVCAVLRTGPDVLRSKKRDWLASHPRMLAMYLARKHTSATYSEIGKHFGSRSHSTVVAGERKVRGWLAENASLALGSAAPVPVRDLLERMERALSV